MKVGIFGIYHQSDERFFDDYTKSNLTVIPYKSIGYYSPDHDVWSECKNYDLVIFPSFGLCSDWMNMHLHTYKSILSSLPKTAWWSFDSHHDKYEYLYRSYFNEWIVFHSNCEHHTGPNTIQVLPFFYQLSYNDILHHIENDPKKSYDVVFHHINYSLGHRDIIAKNIESILQKKSLSYNFNTIESPIEYIKSISRAKVGLNISVLNDINFRSFETWVSNVPLLTNYLEDYQKIPELSEQTIFYNRDLSNFEQKLEIALDTKVDTRRHIIKNHMILKRYIEVINILTDSSFGINYTEGIS